MPSLKKNVVYNSILTCAGYVFPLITFPYVSRVLGVTNIGTCNFVDSIINYFSIISMMGIGTIGVREIAACGDDIDKRSKVFSNLFWLNAISTLIASAILLLAIFSVNQLYVHKELMFIGFAKLLTSFFSIEWFFRGIENFKYITNRSIAVKVVYVVLVFVFVRHQDDTIIYYFLTAVFTTAINAFLNIKYARRFVHLRFRHISFKPYLKPFFILGLYLILTQMYTTVNTAFLGFASGTKEVGYYSTAIKLYGAILSLYTAFTTAMMPRMSSLLSEGKMTEFKDKLNTSFEILLSFTIPLVAISFIYTPEIIRIIAGKGYEGAVLPMRIIMFLVFLTGYDQILVFQILTPLRKDNIIFINSVIGATVGLLLMIALIPSYKSVGSAIVILCSEVAVFLSAQHFVTKFINIEFPLKKFVYFISLSIIPAIICSVVKVVTANIWLRLSALFFVLIYYAYVYIWVVKLSYIRKIVKNGKLSRLLRID